ncbi:hypothetical protein IJT17_02425 [bacterium]|nr:hypothetical protein [bacterium]
MNKYCKFVASTLITLILSGLSTSGQAQPKAASSTQVPEVVKALKDKYGTPQPLPAVTYSVSATPVTTLNQLVDLQRISFPEAWVSSTFYEPRSVSIYRRHAGLHLGYDIAMPAGAEVRVGWPGRVVSIAPWYTNQWGVTVLSGNGTEVTYGHIVPSVKVGDVLNTGSVVGVVSLDHVDVKMRDANGNYVPFGETGQSAPSGAFAASALPVNSRESLMVGWLVAQNAVDTLEVELEMRQREQKTADLNRERLENRYATLHRQEVQMDKFLEEGLVARVEVEKVRRDLSGVRTNLLAAKKTQKDVPEQIAKVKEQLSKAQARLKAAKQEAVTAGITWDEVSALVNKEVAGDRKLAKTVQDYKKDQTDHSAERRAQLKKDLKAQQAKLEEYQKLYEAGGLPRKELEAVQQQIDNINFELQTLK